MKNDPITVFGEVLFDQFPDGANVLGGAPFNVAWHLKAFGQSTQFISRVGTDTLGNQIRAAMQRWGMDVNFLQQDLRFPTGQVQVTIEQGEPSYAILANQAYDYIEMQEYGNVVGHTGLLYHGTLATRSETSRHTLAILKNLHQGKIFVDVNLRQPWWTKADVIKLINEANWVKLNIHELRALQEGSTDLKPSMEIFLSRYKLDGIIITYGEQGASALNNTGAFISVKPSTLTDVVDTVGAGDAFSAIFLLGLNLGWPLVETMERAQAFATAITNQQGATLNDLNFYQAFIKSWGL
jgi:fructokinase